MADKIEYSRLILKRTNQSGQVPTVPPVTATTLNQLTETDLYVGEMFLNAVDDLMWIRTENGVLPISLSGSTGTTGTQTLTQVLFEGNATNGYDIEVTSGDTIVWNSLPIQTPAYYLGIDSSGNTISAVAPTSGGTGTNGTSGTSGINGNPGGVVYDIWDFTTSTPGLQLIRNASGGAFPIAGSWTLLIGEVPVGSTPDYSGIFALLGQGTVINLFNEDKSYYLTYKMDSAPADNGDYWEFPLTYFSGVLSWLPSNGDNVYVTINGIPGSNGTSGTSGTSGINGTSGVNGTSGESGTSGINGTSGESGTSGINGTSGTDGSSGTSGESGTSGTDGSSGINGTSGVSGSSGTSGESGTSGISGSSGTSGESGTSGIDGTSGTSGESGTSGTSGLSGTSGESGTSGVNGTSGESGTSGINGTSGTSGIDGSSGTSGTSGIDGTSGTSGIDGNSGTSGVSGSSGTSGESGTSGTSGINGTSGTSGTSGINGTSGTSGESGTSGIDGTSGTSGTDGSSGTSGIDGSSGTSGVSGSSGTSGANGISAGKTYYLNSSQNSDLAAYKVLSELPTTGATQITALTIPGSTNDYTVEQFVTPQLGFAVIPSGVQRFYLNFLKQAEADDMSAYVELQLLDYTGGTIGSPITSGVESIGWNSGNPYELLIDVVLSTTAIDPTNRMAVTIYANNLESSATDLDFYTEGNEYSFVITSVGVVAATSGTSGTSGQDGTSGTSGISGTSGVSGSSGTSGVGSPGTSGTSGINGISGTSGVNGLGLAAKSGELSGYTGPNILDIAFASPFATDDYSLNVMYSSNFPSIELLQTAGVIAQSTTGFTIDLNFTATANSYIQWTAIAHGETGVAGTSGTSGVSGTSGISGSAGTSGTSFISPYTGNIEIIGQLWVDLFTGVTTSATTIDWDNSNTQEWILGDDTTFTFTNGNGGGNYTLIAQQSTTGATYNITWPSNVIWPGGATPTMSTGASRYDVYTFVYDNVRYFGSYEQDYLYTPPVSPTPTPTVTPTPTPTITPTVTPTVTPTPSPAVSNNWILAQNNDAITTESGDNIEYQY